MRHSAAIDELRQIPSFQRSSSIPMLDGAERPSDSSTHQHGGIGHDSWGLTATQHDSMGTSLGQDHHTIPAVTIPIGHQTSTDSLLSLPQMRSLIGEIPDRFVFLVEESRLRPLSLDQIDGTQSPFIERNLADQFLEQYLTLIHPYRPLFDREALTIQYEQIMTRGLERNVQSALFMAIFALGATISDPIDPARTVYSGDQMIQTAIGILLPSWAMTFSGDIVLSRALVLCALYYCYTLEPLVAWRFVHLASTTIQQMSDFHLASCRLLVTV